MIGENVINVSDLTIENLESLKVRETIKIESNGKIVNDTWDDIPHKLSTLVGSFINEMWKKAWDKSFEFEYQNKRYSLWHGNTKWFSLTRLS